MTMMMSMPTFIYPSIRQRGEKETKETLDPTVFLQKFTEARPNFLSISDSNQRK
jgi:hypothetical protein